MKIHVSYFPRMRHTHCTFCSYRSLCLANMVTYLLSLSFHWRDFPETPFLACATNVVSLVVIGRKLQFVASFLPVGGVSGVGGRAYWALWNGEGWVFICLELQFDKVYCTYGSGEKTLDQCFSTAGPRPDTGPWHQLYRAARDSPGICHFSFPSIFY